MFFYQNPVKTQNQNFRPKFFWGFLKFCFQRSGTFAREKLYIVQQIIHETDLVSQYTILLASNSLLYIVAFPVKTTFQTPYFDTL